MIRNPDLHTVRKGLTPHPIVRTSNIPASRAANPNGSLSHGERPDPITHPAVGSLPHRTTYLAPTNTRLPQHDITYHIILYYIHPNKYRPKQMMTANVGSQGVQKNIRSKTSHTVRKCLKLHPIVKTSGILVSQAANPNRSLSHIKRS